MSNAFESSDYAGSFGKNVQFYYGYEETNDKDEWLFVAKKGNVKIEEWTAYQISERAEKNHFECGVVLAEGIAKFFDTWDVIEVVKS